MKSFITRRLLAAVFVVAAASLGSGAVNDDANGSIEEIERETIEINVRPFCIVKGASVVYVIVSAEVPYISVDTGTVMLGIYIDGEYTYLDNCFTESDNNGNLVAKFLYGDVEPLVKEPLALFALTGRKLIGDAFEGFKDVRVHENPRG